MSTLRDFCKDRQYQVINIDHENEILSKGNKTITEIKLNCNHIQRYKLSSIYQYRNHDKLICKFCKRKEKNPNLSDDETTIKCMYCDTVLQCTNKFKNDSKCKDCKPEKLFNEWFRPIYQDNFDKSVRINDGKFIMDFSFIIDGQLILIELDEHNHKYECGSKQTHLKKDDYILANDMKLIRIHHNYLNSFKNNYKQIFSRIMEVDGGQILIYHGDNDKERKESISFYRKVYEGSKYIQMHNL